MRWRPPAGNHGLRVVVARRKRGARLLVLVYGFRRLALAIPVLFIVSVLVFLMRVAVPGDPVELMFFGESPPPEVVTKIRSDWGLDRPLHEQYLTFVGRALRGDLGRSYRSQQPIAREIAVRYPNTLQLAIGGLVVGLTVGLAAGVLSAAKQNSLFDTASMVVALLGVSMPSFWLALVLMNKVAVDWRLLPPMGSGSWRHLILPSITLGLLSASTIARMTRSSMLEVLRMDYIRTAKAKGLSERVTIYKHGLRNALIPVVTLMGLQVGNLLGGAFITETVFAFHGLGQLGVQAIATRDFPMVQGVTLVIASTYLLVNVAVDVLYGVINPRIKFS